MSLLNKIKAARQSDGFKEKVLELATEFALEASVLSGVLGILESAIAWHRWPTQKALVFSVLFAFLFFAIACTLQALKIWDVNPTNERAASDLEEEEQNG